jgi:hypothetical protein
MNTLGHCRNAQQPLTDYHGSFAATVLMLGKISRKCNPLVTVFIDNSLGVAFTALLPTNKAATSQSDSHIRAVA